jgi:hypothetical protein
MTAADMMCRLASRYAPPEYALLPQVRNGTGFDGRRTADAVAISCWPSRGIYLHGFEVKVERGDWLRELRDPAKAEEVAAYCHFWWIVAPDEHVAKPEEIPADWGLLALHGDVLVERKPARTQTAKTPDMPFLAAVLRAAQQVMIPKSEIEERIRKEAEKRAARMMRLAGGGMCADRSPRQLMYKAVRELSKLHTQANAALREIDRLTLAGEAIEED